MNHLTLRITKCHIICTFVLAMIAVSQAAVAQLAPAGSIYVQQPAGVHYLFGTAGVQTGAGFYYVNYNTSQFDVIGSIAVSPNGTFSGTSSLTGHSVSGTISTTTISLTYNGVAISAPKEAPFGPTQQFAGGYSGSLTNPSLGVYVASVVVTRHGVCLAFAANSSAVSIGVGSITPSGNLSITTLDGEHLSGHLNVENGTAQGKLQSSFGYIYDYAVARVGVPRLANISTRGVVGGGEQVLIGGFIVKDGGKTVLITARGPSLTSQGVQNAVQNPRLDLYRGNQIIASNADWKSNANASDIAGSTVGPTDDREAALLVPLEPGAYTVVVSSETVGQQGVGLVEVFGID